MGLLVRHKFSYGLGQVASGTKDLIMGFFVVQLYSLTLGLPGTWVGAAAFFALAVDAFTDPFFGHMSDQTVSKRWGRRHGLMLVAIAPFCLGILLVFNPPTAFVGVGVGLLIWMVVFDSLTRASLSAFYVPYLALGAEASDDYQERTSIMGWRFMLAYVLIIALLVSYNNYVLEDLRDVKGYRWVGIWTALVCAICMLAAALGTRSWIGRRKIKTPPKTRWTHAFVEMYDALSVKSFRIAVIAFSFSAVMTGLFTLMFPVVMGGFWGLDQKEIGLIFLSVLCAAPPAFLVAPYLSEKIGKKPAIILVTVLYGVFGTFPVFGRLMGIMPGNDDAMLLPILWVFFWLTQTFVMCALMLFYSMAADVADDYYLQKGKRKEGIILAGLSFGQKFGLGFGMLLAGLAIDIIDYPKGEDVVYVAPEILMKLGYIVGPILLVMILIPAFICFAYPLTRDRHAQVQAEIIARDGQLAE